MAKYSPDLSVFVLSSLSRIEQTQGATALDAPCGFGRHAFELQDRGYTVTALDIDPSRVAFVSGEFWRRGPIGSSGTAFVADLRQSGGLPARVFDVALVIDYACEVGTANVLARVRLGGFAIVETFRANGGNWRGLPAPGRLRALFQDDFEILQYDERPVGPTRSEAATVRCFALRCR